MCRGGNAAISASRNGAEANSHHSGSERFSMGPSTIIMTQYRIVPSTRMGKYSAAVPILPSTGGVMIIRLSPIQ